MDPSHDRTPFINDLSSSCSSPNYINPNSSSTVPPLYSSTFVNLEYFTIYGVILIAAVLYLIASAIGTETTWYLNLIKPDLNPWYTRTLWIIATIVSYITLFLLLPEISFYHPSSLSPSIVYKARTVAPLFLIGTLISLSWTVIFYYYQNIGLSLWLTSILFIYNFWLFMYVWYIKPLAAVFMIPILAIYIYLVYFMTNLAYLNHVIL